MIQKPAHDDSTAREEIGLDDDNEGQAPLFMEFIWFLKDNKKWWLVPMILIFLLLGALMMMGSGPLSPFLYTFL